MNQCMMCGRAPDVRYVVYRPQAHYYELCGACACSVLWDRPGRSWAAIEAIHEAEAIVEAVSA